MKLIFVSFLLSDKQKMQRKKERRQLFQYLIQSSTNLQETTGLAHLYGNEFEKPNNFLSQPADAKSDFNPKMNGT